MVIFLYNPYIFGIHIKPCYIQNRFIANSVIKRFVCMYIVMKSSQSQNSDMKYFLFLCKVHTFLEINEGIQASTNNVRPSGEKITHKPLYNTVHYNTVSDTTCSKDGSQKFLRLKEIYRNGSCLLYNLYHFVCIEHGCMTNKSSTSDPGTVL